MSVTNYVDSVSMGSSDVAIRNDVDVEGYNKCLDINEFSVAATNRELVNLENAAVNIDSSSDVIIGPVTQFHINGNVTIHQKNERLPTGMEQNDDIGNVYNTNSKENDCEEIFKTILRYLKAFCHKRKKDLGRIFICVLLSSCAILLYVSIVLHKDLVLDPEPLYGRYLGNFTIHYVSDWGGKTVTGILDNPLPVGLVIVRHTGTDTCFSLEKCSEILRILQIYQTTTFGYKDICDNLFIGGNGNIYVGRGWDTRNCYLNKLSIAISFIGNFNKVHLNDNMKTSFKLLLQQGIDLSKLPENYLMVAYNQTVISNNPGDNVYNYIKTLPNFFDIDLRKYKYKDMCSIYKAPLGKKLIL
ncbi:unnamed protein product [Psylliodes chrysocephalus]|uniref:Peptidoglycan recognition protein family domain-containing protein n=1 Tax=Psylliodes chrysocephalus TaxID=3402493 RepID=A0A9P0DA39_9CUCU|nr:unnamed protein product [Psylliodes chrysocephala]